MKKTIILSCLVFLIVQTINAQCAKSRTEWENYFKERINYLDPIEGIWDASRTLKLYSPDNVLQGKQNESQIATYAIYKEGESFNTCVIDDASVSRFHFQNSATSGLYLLDFTYEETSSAVKTNAILPSSGIMEFSYKKPLKQLRYEMGADYPAGISAIYEYSLIKMSPKSTEYNGHKASSGSGFGITSNGIIVTNFHVIADAKTIKVKGINSDFNKTFKAKILVSDKTNDLALIQIDDYSFTSLGTIPYALKTGLAGVGENIFVLGYPLRASMGDEVKLTNGIISSKTGFQGDITCYQISAPVQPGNSGGPLFDNQGYLIGIITAKHIGAENASYAIKSSYLTSLIELLSSPPKLQTVNSLTGKSLPTQVEMVKKFVYIIESE
jgi:S1-C subfamily serine protease